MQPNPYHFYALEFYVQYIRADKDISNLSVEVKLFDRPFIVFKSRMPQDVPSLSLWEMKPAYTRDEPSEHSETVEMPPFELDLKSTSSYKNTGESEQESEYTKGSLATFGSSGKLQMDSSNPPTGDQEPQAEDQSERTAEAETVESGGPELEDDRQPLRMFPKDPKGMPYNKVKKGAEEEAEAEERETSSVESERKSRAQRKEGNGKNAVEGEEPAGKKTEKKGKQSVKTTEKSDELHTRNVKKTYDEKPDFKLMKCAASIPNDVFEAGVTVILPMLPLEMLHRLQREPLWVRVRNDRNMISEGFLDMWPLFQCVVHAERGSPTPISSACELNLMTTGDFNATVASEIRLAAFGSQSITKISSPYFNPNAMMNHIRIEETLSYRKKTMDIHDAPPILSSPGHAGDGCHQPPPPEQREKEYPKKKERDIVIDDVAFCPIHRLITPQPKDTYETMRWKIDRILGLTEVNIEEFKLPEGERPTTKAERENEEELQEWLTNKKRALVIKRKSNNNKQKETRALLQQILKGMNAPAPITLENEVESAEVKEDLTEEEVEDIKARKLFNEIRRQQREEKFIKHYKRLFRRMLRIIDGGNLSIDRVREKNKARDTMDRILAELESYSAGIVERAFVKAMAEKAEKRKKEDKWALNLWPDLDERKEDEEEGEMEEEDDESKYSTFSPR